MRALRGAFHQNATMEAKMPDENVTSLHGTLYGSLTRTPEASWTGTVLLSIAGAPPIRGTFVDRSEGFDMAGFLEGRPYRGGERCTLTFDDGSLEIAGEFVGVPATPGLWQRKQVGELRNGTGRFAAISGRVSVDGPYVSPAVEDAPAYIAELHGSAAGV